MTLFTHIFETLVIVENMDATAASDRTLFRNFLEYVKQKNFEINNVGVSKHTYTPSENF